MNQLWCNGQWLDADQHPAASQDRGAFLGLALFETLAGLDGRPVFAGRHLSRVSAGCERLGWTLDFPDFEQVAIELLRRNSLETGRARLRLIVSAGTGSLNDLSQGPDRVVWLAAFQATEPPASVSVCLSPWPRNERSPLAGLKTGSYAENLVALDHARKQGFDEILFLNTAAEVCETATANIFVVKNGILLTPPAESGCLPGIGREVLCEIALEQGIRCEQRTLFIGDVEGADEIFISSSTRGPVPVTTFRERSLPVGQVTRGLRELWKSVQ